jgi:hypothetical protein
MTFSIILSSVPAFYGYTIPTTLSIMTRSIITYSTLRFSKKLSMALSILSSNVPSYTISTTVCIMTVCIMTFCIITLGIIRFIISALSILGFSGHHVKMCLSFLWSEYVHAFGFFNEADTLDSSAILIQVQSIYTQGSGRKPS